MIACIMLWFKLCHCSSSHIETSRMNMSRNSPAIIFCMLVAVNMVKLIEQLSNRK